MLILELQGGRAKRFALSSFVCSFERIRGHRCFSFIRDESPQLRYRERGHRASGGDPHVTVVLGDREDTRLFNLPCSLEWIYEAA